MRIKIVSFAIVLIGYVTQNALSQTITYPIKTMETTVDGKKVKVTYKPNAIKITVNESAHKIALASAENPFDTVVKITHAQNADKPNSHVRVFMCLSSPNEGSQAVTVMQNRISKCIAFTYPERTIYFNY